MGLFDRFRKPPADETLDAIAARLRAGDSQGALNAITAKVENTGRRSGTSSPAYAAVLYEDGTVCLSLGMRPRAIQSLRAASRITGTTHDDEKNRLTYLMNLAECLAADGQLEEAMSAAREGLEQRERFYGPDHPGYAYGLESLAEIALARGEYAVALKHAQPALAIYDQHGHFRVPHTWSLLFLAAAGAEAKWSQLQIAPDMADRILQQLTEHSLPIAPAVERQAIELLATLAADVQRILDAWKELVVRAREAKDQATHRAALEMVRTLAERNGDQALALDVDLGLGYLQDESGDRPAASTSYEQAVRRARSIGSPLALSRAMRNAGLFFVAHDAGRGLALLRDAVAIDGAPPEELSRSRIALGIQLQHRADLATARPLLVSALQAIDPAHPDAICARVHLKALDEHGACECRGIDSEVHAQVERIARERLPEGLVEAIDFKEGDVSIRVSRPMTEAEARLVADTVQLAVAEMRKRYS
jgi:tetratricopeptide (TPR) repeat protein